MKRADLTVKIGGIDCSGCAKNIEKKLLAAEGIIDARINIVYKRLYVSFNPLKITEKEIFSIITNAGFSILSEYSQTSNIDNSSRDPVNLLTARKTKRKSFWTKKELYTTVTSGLLLIIGVLLRFVLKIELASLIVLIIATIIGGLFIFRKAFYSLKTLNLDINLLMTIASISAIIIGETIEAASIVFLFSIAELAEAFSVESAKSSIETLIDYAPTEVTVLKGDKEEVMSAESVPVGSMIIVRPGERISLDGKIVHGGSYINQAPITGESIPVAKAVGDLVYAGTLNEDGIIKIEVTTPYEEIFLKKIIELVESSDQRAPIERFVDTFARYYTPVMLLLASLTMSIPPLVTGQPFIDWVYKALIILVISCPCAVVLSTPITIVTTLNRAARNGVLIKGGSYIESLSKIRVFAFDKTGTLTVGHPTVVDIFAANGISREELLRISGSLELNSRHPIAKAIKEKMEEENLHPYEVKNFQSITSKGVRGVITNQEWWLGSPKLILDNGVSLSDEIATELAILQSEGKTVIVIGNQKEVVGLISVSDQMKEHAKGMIQELKSLEIDKIIMLTGDNYKTAWSIAKELEIDEYKAELLPDQKMEVIKELNSLHRHVAMIGDGVNDAPSLALAEVGIAMGVVGSDIALETADIALMSDRLDTLPYLVTLSRKAMNIIKQNIIIALLVKFALFALAFPGFVTLWMAVLIGDMGLSLLVILNALLRAKGKQMSHEKCDKDLCEGDPHSLKVNDSACFEGTCTT